MEDTMSLDEMAGEIRRLTDELREMAQSVELGPRARAIRALLSRASRHLTKAEDYLAEAMEETP